MHKIEKKEFFQFLLQRSEGFTSYYQPIIKKDKITDYKIIFLTDNFKTLINSDPQLLIDKRISEIYPDFFENGMLEIFNSCISKKEFEISFERKLNFCGKKVWFENKAISYKNGIIMSSRDITRTKSIETKLRKLLAQVEYQNNILKDSESISKTASFRWNLRMKEWYFSDNMIILLDHYKISEEDRFKNGVFELLKNHDIDFLNEQIKSFEYYKKIEPFKFKLIDNKDHTTYFSLSGNFYPSKDGPVFLGVLNDITEDVTNQQLLENKNNALKKSYEELESFSHVVSHDLQEPLRKIQMFISRIDNFEDTARVEKMVHKIEETSNRMQRLIKNMLYYSSISNPDANFQKINLKVLIKEVKKDYKESLQNNDFKVELEKLSSIHGDPILLKQLFSNLISNAIKYKRELADKTILIKEQKFDIDTLKVFKGKTISSEHYKKIIFKDNGIGFDQKYASKVFEIFQRLHDKNKYSGTGIGLAICNKIMKIHNGFIDVESSVNCGTTFYLYFPKQLIL